MAIIKKDGQTIASVPAANLANWMQQNKLDAASLEISLTANELREASRKNIHEKVGDPLSLLGTVNDGATKLLFDFSRLVTALAEADTLKDVRDAAAPFVKTAQGFLDKVESGEVVLPYKLKGEPAVMAEIETRATGVAKALQAQQGG